VILCNLGLWFNLIGKVTLGYPYEVITGFQSLLWRRRCPRPQ
jgi:hypothetical protein